MAENEIGKHSIRLNEMKNFAVEFNFDKHIQVEEGQSLLDASLAAGIPHFHICGGNARCSTCRVLILAGKESLTSPNEKENLLKDEMYFPAKKARIVSMVYV